MKYIPLHICLILFLSLCLFSCKKDKGIMDPKPQITLNSVTPTTVKQFQDPIIILLDYQDGDGDLGFIEADSFSVMVQDSRLQNPDWHHISPLAPVGEEIAIQGTLRFEIKGTFLLGNGGQETTTFSIRIKDRSNNWSNEVVTPKITIVP